MTNLQKCKECGKRTKFMYIMNEGQFCSNHKDSALNRQRWNNRMSEERERWERVYSILTPKSL